ncbi:MAG: hypothetical protein HY698_02400 [Deltaproteobacteria bacterium]|nr:hypothetical protein [Deltaproteobacteria bacterium]
MTWIALVILLFVVGVALLAIEILAIPGFGLVGLLGCVGIIGASVIAWGKLGAGYGVVSIAAGIGASGLMLWLFPKTAAGQAMVLKETHRSRAGSPELSGLLGKTGKTLTPLRPSGTCEVDDRTVDVVTDGLYVEAGAVVRVVRVEGVRVVVEPVSQSD